jgi:hypothetical protein
MADVRQQVMLSLTAEFEDYATFEAGDYLPVLTVLFARVIAWSSALAPLRVAFNS